MSPAVTTTLAVLALVLAILALVLATIANRRWARRPSRSSTPAGSAAGDERHDAVRSEGEVAAGAPAPAPERGVDESLAAGLAEVRDQVAGLRAHGEDLAAQSAAVRLDLASLRSQLEEVAARADAPGDPTALRHVALVRYDAFADVGGRLSYSVALLDDTSSGLVLTTLAGKADVRTYVRTVSAGSPDGSLTAEEKQAIDAAVGSRQ
jgi:hypothetical protein